MKKGLDISTTHTLSSFSLSISLYTHTLLSTLFCKSTHKLTCKDYTMSLVCVAGNMVLNGLLDAGLDFRGHLSTRDLLE